MGDRLRILQELSKEPSSIDDLSDKLRTVPQSSIYRHINKLHQAKIIKVAKVLKIRGASERIYQVRGQKLKGFIRTFKREFKELLG